MAQERPSPHRFRRGASPQKNVKPSSTSSRKVADRANDGFTESEMATSHQFAATPRFAHKKLQAPRTSRPSSPPKSGFVEALRASARVREDVVKQPASTHDAIPDPDGIESQVTEIVEQQTPEASVDLPYSPKRRRLDDVNADATPARPVFRAPAAPITRPPVRFTPLQSSTATSTAEDHASNRPSFLRNAASRNTPAEPLPEAFSPHRRGQKFVPGGLASVVQQWVIEAGQSAVQSRRGQAFLKGDDFVSKVKIKDLKGEGPFVTRAYTAEGEQVRVLLAQNGNSVRGQSCPEKDNVVGIRAPTWDISIEGAIYTVAVDWKILT